MFRGKLIVSLAAAMIVLLAAAKTTSAQYPTPMGGLFCSTSSVVVQQNSSFTFSATLVDISGNAVGGQLVNFSVQSSSGGAYLSSSIGYTDFSGMATITVYTGSATGQIAVYANGGSFNCQAVVQVPDVPHITCNITQISIYQYSFIVYLQSSSGYYISQSVLYSIISTGGGASLSAVAGVTGANGQATVTVYTLPTSGLVTVSGSVAGQSCQASITPPPAPIVYQQPAPPVYQPQPVYPTRPNYIAPPVTGDAGLLGSTSSSSTGYMILAVILGLSLTTAAKVTWSRAHNRS